MLICNPPVFVLLFLVFVFTVLLSHYISLGSVICALAFPLANSFMPFYVSPAPPVGIIVSLLMAILVVVLHRKNIVRLWEGTESKVSFRSKKSEKN
jgi:glycerol-3-phosphate acyltransferase PlsY